MDMLVHMAVNQTMTRIVHRWPRSIITSWSSSSSSSERTCRRKPKCTGRWRTDHMSLNTTTSTTMHCAGFPQGERFMWSPTVSEGDQVPPCLHFSVDRCPSFAGNDSVSGCSEETNLGLGSSWWLVGVQRLQRLSCSTYPTHHEMDSLLSRSI